MKLHDPEARASIVLAGKTFFKGQEGFFEVPDNLSASARKQGLVGAPPVQAQTVVVTEAQPVIEAKINDAKEKPASTAPVATAPAK